MRKTALMNAIVLLTAAVAFGYNWSVPNAPYLNPSLSFDERIKDLMSRLTVIQKAMQCWNIKSETPGLIPFYQGGNECLHGPIRPGKFTIFPQSIGMGSTWDTALVRATTTAMSDEARAKYNRYQGLQPTDSGVAWKGLLAFFSPTVNLARDPRWGRTQETYGEDPYLTSRLGIAYVLGLQGNDPKYIKTGVAVKHFAANNEEHNRLLGYAAIPTQSLREYYLEAFRPIVQEAKPNCIMAAFNGINGIPCHANKWLLTDLLRTEWGFRGYVVSDCGALEFIYSQFHYASSMQEAAAMAMKAGVDLECDGAMFGKPLIDAYNAGQIGEAVIDTACKRALMLYFRTGFFDYLVDPNRIPWSTIPATRVGCPEHMQLALQSARESIVLLKNDTIGGKKLLPIDKNSVTKITVVGPNAAHFEIGSYGNPFGSPNPLVDPLTGLRNKLNGTNVQINYVTWPNDAKSAASSSDLVIAVMGNQTNQAEGEGVDRGDIILPSEQTTYLQQIYSVNRKIVLVLINGGPVTVNWEAANIPAIAEAWFPGEQGGNAIADVLFGDFNPSGKLPVTVYTGVNQFPGISDYDITKGRTYMYLQSKPLYPFGHGLSYTAFTYSNLRVSPSTIGPACTCNVKVDITNAGGRTGDEIAQMYIHDNAMSVKRPIKQLKGFARLSLQAGETKTATFRLPYGSLAYYDTVAKAWAVNQGAFSIMVGSSSQDIRATTQVTADKNGGCSTGIAASIEPACAMAPHRTFTLLAGSRGMPAIGQGNLLRLFTLQGRQVATLLPDREGRIAVPVRLTKTNTVLIAKIENKTK